MSSLVLLVVTCWCLVTIATAKDTSTNKRCTSEEMLHKREGYVCGNQIPILVNTTCRALGLGVYNPKGVSCRRNRGRSSGRSRVTGDLCRITVVLWTRLYTYNNVIVLMSNNNIIMLSKTVRIYVRRRQYVIWMPTWENIIIWPTLCALLQWSHYTRNEREVEVTIWQILKAALLVCDRCTMTSLFHLFEDGQVVVGLEHQDNSLNH